MDSDSTIFNQLISFIPRYEFRKCVERYNGNYKVKSFSCWDQFLCMMFAQLTFRESLRDIETCLRVIQPKLYHMGFRGKVSRNTLANANQVRNWRIYADFAQVLIGIARPMYANESFGIDLEQSAYALDSTTIDLCLSLFPWAKFRTGKSGVKLHTVLDLYGNIPSIMLITNANVHDVNTLDLILFEPGALYIMDRGYLDFARLYAIQESSAFFIIRAKSNFCFNRRYSHPVDKTTGLRSDQTIILKGFYAKKNYPEKLRRIRFYDTSTKKYLTFLTNNFSLSAITITELYRCRWQIEIFFKWIKQNLRIKTFFGTSINAVKTQIWIAISVYVLVAIAKKQLKSDLNLYTILQILSVSLFEKIPIYQALTPFNFEKQNNSFCNQLSLFN